MALFFDGITRLGLDETWLVAMISESNIFRLGKLNSMCSYFKLNEVCQCRRTKPKKVYVSLSDISMLDFTSSSIWCVSTYLQHAMSSNQKE